MRTLGHVLALALALAGCSNPPTAADERLAADTSLAFGQDAVVTGTGGGLNLRSGPSRADAVLAVMPEGSRLRVDGPPQNGYWQVTWQAQAGWAYGAYLRTATALPATLQAAVDQLVDEVVARSAGTDVAIAVEDLTTGEYAQVDENVPHVSASAAKAVWVAAALDGVGIAAVQPYAAAIFERSDNAASGSVIDLIGADAVNDFYWNKAGMTASALTQWSFGRTRVATNSPRVMGSDNYFTPGDVVRFLAALDAGTLLAADQTATLQNWMTWTPRSGYGGWMGSDLPAEARAGMRHKAGWLPPGCCGDDRSYNTLNEIGLIDTPNGHRLAIAIFARHGRDYWNAQVPYVEHAACVLYRVAAQDAALDCR